METEQTLRRRIKTVTDLHNIVRTMKALAAVSARQAEAALQAVDAYAQTVDKGLQVVLRNKVSQKSGRKKPVTQVAAIIFGSDVGLCGHFNEDLVAFAIDKMNGFQVASSARKVLAIGSRIGASLTERGHPVSTVFATPASATALNGTIQHILPQLNAWQEQGIEQVMLIYSKSCTPHFLQLLPIDPQQFTHLRQTPWPSHNLPTYSMVSERLLAALLREYLFVCLFRACAASLASEHLMRLRTTQAAEKNIQEKLDDLQAEYRTRRQDAIDAELLDIGAGFEAVSNL